MGLKFEMYVLEVFIKWLNKRQTEEVIPEKPNFEEKDDALFCKHEFMPVDSTGEVLACVKCGYTIKKMIK